MRNKKNMRKFSQEKRIWFEQEEIFQDFRRFSSQLVLQSICGDKFSFRFQLSFVFVCQQQKPFSVLPAEFTQYFRFSCR